MKMQRWTDKRHGKVTDGEYRGCLLRAGACFKEVYIDILMPGVGWQRMDGLTVPDSAHAPYDTELTQLKESVDRWLDIYVRRQSS